MRFITWAAIMAAICQWNCTGAAGSTAPETPTPANAEPSDDSQPEGAASAGATGTTQGLPTECKQQGKLCLPPPDFVTRLCADKFPGVAIAMFAKGTPWTRRYVRLPEVEPRNTAGGPSSDAKLVAGEEVLMLQRHGGGSDVQVSGAADYDTLRWDGTCASLSDLELAANPPGMTKSAPVLWKFIDPPIQDALLGDSAIQKARDAQGKACGGAAAGGGRACEQARRNLTQAITSAVRKGIELPAPSRLP